MQIQSVHNYNQCIPFRNRKVYYLYDLAHNYDKLEPAEKEWLQRSNFNKEKLRALRDGILHHIPSAVTVDNINGIIVQKTNFGFEIGDTCKLLWQLFFLGLRQNDIHFELKSDEISIDNIKKCYEKAQKIYNELKKKFEGAGKEEFYKSKTLDMLYSSKFKIAPQKSEKGYLTTVINNKSGNPENVYIKIREDCANTERHRLYIDLLNYNDYDKYPRTRHVGETYSKKYRLIGFLDSKFDSNGNIVIYNIHQGDSYSSEEYSGVAYRLIQALIEYSSQKNIENIIIDHPNIQLPLYTKAGFGVNYEKDRLMDNNDEYLIHILKVFEEHFDIPRKKLISVLKKRTRNGISGYGENETFVNFNELLYQKNKYFYYSGWDCELQLPPQAREEWLKRIRLQPILTINSN